MNNKHFEAGNLYLATYLLYKGFKVRGITGQGRTKRILFDDTPQVHQACREFYDNSQARVLFDCYRRAKDYLFQNGT